MQKGRVHHLIDQEHLTKSARMVIHTSQTDLTQKGKAHHLKDHIPKEKVIHQTDQEHLIENVKKVIHLNQTDLIHQELHHRAIDQADILIKRKMEKELMVRIEEVLQEIMMVEVLLMATDAALQDTKREIMIFLNQKKELKKKNKNPLKKLQNLI
jgi:hypothetical protein